MVGMHPEAGVCAPPVREAGKRKAEVRGESELRTAARVVFRSTVIAVRAEVGQRLNFRGPRSTISRTLYNESRDA